MKENFWIKGFIYPFAYRKIDEPRQYEEERYRGQSIGIPIRFEACTYSPNIISQQFNFHINIRSNDSKLLKFLNDISGCTQALKEYRDSNSLYNDPKSEEYYWVSALFKFFKNKFAPKQVGLIPVEIRIEEI